MISFVSLNPKGDTEIKALQRSLMRILFPALGSVVRLILSGKKRYHNDRRRLFLARPAI